MKRPAGTPEPNMPPTVTYQASKQRKEGNPSV